MLMHETGLILGVDTVGAMRNHFYRVCLSHMIDRGLRAWNCTHRTPREQDSLPGRVNTLECSSSHIRPMHAMQASTINQRIVHSLLPGSGMM